MWFVGSYQQSHQRVVQSGKPTDELNVRNYGTLTQVFAWAYLEKMDTNLAAFTLFIVFLFRIQNGLCYRGSCGASSG